MDIEGIVAIVFEQKIIKSTFLKRDVIVDFYLPKRMHKNHPMHLLLINDGQDLAKMNFLQMLNTLTASNEIQDLFCVGIHAGERKQEYGTANVLDFGQRGALSSNYNQFILLELIPFITHNYSIPNFTTKNIAGFSLGGLTAIDMVWNNPTEFCVAGVFSGSLWWRTKDLNDGYEEDKHRIMHQQIKSGKYYQGLRFYFTTGSLDETADRNNNGIIDSIDDTLALIEDLKSKGYTDKDIKYINYEDGKHDVETWGRAMPDFLCWGWGTAIEQDEIFESC